MSSDYRIILQTENPKVLLSNLSDGNKQEYFRTGEFKVDATEDQLKAMGWPTEVENHHRWFFVISDEYPNIVYAESTICFLSDVMDTQITSLANHLLDYGKLWIASDVSFELDFEHPDINNNYYTRSDSVREWYLNS